jgi:hypothetical protein
MQLTRNERNAHARKCHHLQEILGTTKETLSKKSLQLSKALKLLMLHERTAGNEETPALLEKQSKTTVESNSSGSRA